MVIVGLTGAIGSGKTTFGTFLNAQAARPCHLESSELIIEVANDLLQQTAVTFPSTTAISTLNQWLALLPIILEDRVHRHVDWEALQLTDQDIEKHPEAYRKLFEYIESQLAKRRQGNTAISAANKSEHRAILQWLGGYLAKRVDGAIWYRELIERGKALPGVDLLTLGGVRFPADADCIRQHQGVIVELVRPSQASQDITDITERERGLITPDISVVNDGTLEQLERLASNVYEDIMSHDSKQQYRAGSVQS
jgi:hypothetical protein